MNELFLFTQEHLTSGRGLETGSDLQTFAIAVSPLFRAQYDRIYEPLDQVILID